MPKKKNEFFIISDEDVSEEEEKLNKKSSKNKKKSTFEKKKRKTDNKSSKTSNKKKKKPSSSIDIHSKVEPINSIEKEEHDKLNTQQSTSTSIDNIENVNNENITIPIDPNIELKRKNNIENNPFLNIPFYQWKIIIFYLDFKSIINLSNVSYYFKFEIFNSLELYQLTEDFSFYKNNYHSILTLYSFVERMKRSFPNGLKFHSLGLDFSKYIFNLIKKKDFLIFFKEFSFIENLNLKIKNNENLNKWLEILSECFINRNELNNKKLKGFYLNILKEENNKINKNSNIDNVIKNFTKEDFLQFINNLYIHTNELQSLQLVSDLNFENFNFNYSDFEILDNYFNNSLNNLTLPVLNGIILLSLLFSAKSNTTNSLQKIDDNLLLNNLQKIKIQNIICNDDLFFGKITERHFLKKLIINNCFCKDTTFLQILFNNLPNLEYFKIKLIAKKEENETNRPNGNIYIKHLNLKYLKFTNFINFYNTHFIQLDCKNLNYLKLKNFSEILILTEKLNNLRNLKLKNGYLLSGQLHSLIEKCVDSLQKITLKNCINIKFISVVKNPFENNFNFLRKIKIINCNLLEKFTISCIGLTDINKFKDLFYLEKIKIINATSFKEIFYETGNFELVPSLNYLYLENVDNLQPLQKISLNNLNYLFYKSLFESLFWDFILKHNNLNNLKELNINFKSNQIFTDSFASRFFYFLQKLINLEKCYFHCKMSTYISLLQINSNSLKEFTISSEDEMNSNLSLFIKMLNLEKLNIFGISNIKTITPNLYSLNLNNLCLDNLVILNDKNSSIVKNLKDLSFVNVNVRRSKMKIIEDFIDNLQNLNKLNYLINDEDKDKDTITNYLKDKILHLNYLTNINIKLLSHLQSFTITPSMKTVDIRCKKLQSISFLKSDNNEFQLKKLNLSNNVKLSKITLPPNKLNYLSVLDFRGSKLKEKSIVQMLPYTPNVLILRLACCSSITSEFLQQVAKVNRNGNFENLNKKKKRKKEDDEE
ncbi:hypothetical protein ABK040_002116 [Willaertia magna]